MNVLETSSHGVRSMCQIGMPMSKLIGVTGRTKPDKFDLEVKCQHRIRNMNVRVTSSFGEDLCVKYGTPIELMVNLW